ncbi:MAG: aldehyde dehydrogenase family protein [Candidatus Ranarchaeia archaeon]
MGKIISTNPGKDYEKIGEVESSKDDEIKNKVAKANEAKTLWKELGVKERIKLIQPIYDEIKQREKEFAELITKEVGKPITQSIDEVIGALEELKWYIENAESSIKDETTHEDKKSLHKIVYEPWGTVATITPWNYPLEMPIWGIFPNLLVGNTVVLKVSEECPLVGKLLEEVMNNHNLPEGVFSEVYGDGKVGEKLVNENIDLIWFTGSSKVGMNLYKVAADKFIKVILEMGGSNPCVVFEDVDVQQAVKIIYSGRFSNCGQVCDAIKRLIVHESIHDQVVEQLVELTKIKKLGDPELDDTDIGSLVAKRQLKLLEEQLKDASHHGAEVVLGGKAPDIQGAYFEPTILTNITREMRVWKEEVFGPMLPVIKFKTEKEAVELANDTPYGLGSRVITADIDRAKRVASKIQAGTVEINQGSHWLGCNPFGGYKNSGMGREHGMLGFRELCQVKVISMEKK